MLLTRKQRAGLDETLGLLYSRMNKTTQESYATVTRLVSNIEAILEKDQKEKKRIFENNELKKVKY